MILDVLAVHKTVKVGMLTETLNVSHVTLRKDLNKLEKRGIIKCTHGYVSLDEANNTGKRVAVNYLLKQKIAKAAAQIVEDGETIMVGSGSCCALFAEELALERKNITIITNSVFIANFICQLPNIKIILLGGYFQPETQVVIGSMVFKFAENFYIDKFFLGVEGFIPHQGFTGNDYLRTETLIGLSRYAKKIFILTDSTKFARRGTYELIQLGKITGLFTDDGIPKEAEKTLCENKIELYKAQAERKLEIVKSNSQFPTIN